MLNSFIIAETELFVKKIQKSEFKRIYQKIKDVVYPQLKANPFYGPNIKKLKGEFADIYRYRIGEYRLFNTIDTNKIIVFVINISHRKESY